MNTRPFLKNRKIRSRRKPANAEHLLLVSLTAFLFLLPVGAIAFAAGNTITKPAPRPILKGAIDTDAPNNAKEEKKTEAKPAREPDFAYGAYQRGLYLTAFELALPRAESGDPVAQTLIAELFWKGLGVARDRKKAVDWYKFAAEGGDRAAQFAYGNMLLRGNVVETDLKLGERYLRQAAEAGHVRAQFNLAQVLTAKRPTWAGFKKALPWYEKAANAGLADAQYAMANIHADAKGVIGNDDVKARQWLAKAAEGGLDSAQLEMGIWLANGRGGKKDEKSAIEWLMRAALQRNVAAQNRLARAFANGVGTKQDMVHAAAWHIVARRAGHIDTEMDRLFDSLPEIDKKRGIELANRLTR